MCQKVCHKKCQKHIKRLLLRNNVFYYRTKIIVNGCVKDKRISLHTGNIIEACKRMGQISKHLEEIQELEELKNRESDTSKEFADMLWGPVKKSFIESKTLFTFQDNVVEEKIVEVLLTKGVKLLRAGMLKVHTKNGLFEPTLTVQDQTGYDFPKTIWPIFTITEELDNETFGNIIRQHDIIKILTDKNSAKTSYPSEETTITHQPQNMIVQQVINSNLTEFPTIQNLLTDFKMAKHYDTDKKDSHGWKVSSNLDRIFNENGISLDKSITFLNNQAIIRKMTDSVKNYKNAYNKPISADTQANHLEPFRAFLRYCQNINQSYINNAYIESIDIPRSRTKEIVGHTAYSAEELHKIFDTKHDFFIKNPYLFWIVVIALYTGARKNAATTLKYQNIIQIADIPCIEFIKDDDNKKLKNNATERVVPISKQLLQLGFLDFVNNRKKSLKASEEDFIFPECFKIDGNNKLIWREACLRPLMDFFRKLGIKNDEYESIKKTREKYDFHSFRKNANQQLKARKVPVDKINMIIGWGQDNLSDGSYNYDIFSDKLIQELHNIIDKDLVYDFLQQEFDEWKILLANKYHCTKKMHRVQQAN